VDEDTLQQLLKATENDLYLSNISPLGVPFNSLRGNTKDVEKTDRINKGTPGSACPKKYVALNNEFTERGICSASRQYQKAKLKDLQGKGLSEAQYNEAHDDVVEKSCICVGLGTSALISHGLDTRQEGEGVSICPGPNIAYFNRKMSLSEMIDHIYGRINVITHPNRPNLFVKELNLYIDYLKDQIQKSAGTANQKALAGFSSFSANLIEGIAYYEDMINGLQGFFSDSKERILQELSLGREKLELLRVTA
jgi:hypothetical protein